MDTDHSPDTWSLAGGHLEYGESFEECAAREVLEETGIEIENVQFLTAVETLFEADKRHYVTIFMKAYAKKQTDGKPPTPQVRERCL